MQAGFHEYLAWSLTCNADISEDVTTTTQDGSSLTERDEPKMRVRILVLALVCSAVLALCATFIHPVASASPFQSGTDLAFAQTRILDSNGTPIAGAQVQIRRVSFGNQPVGTPITEPIVGTGTTDATGHLLVKMTAPTAALLHAQNDVVNYEVDLVGASGLPVPIQYISRYYGADKY